MEINIGWIGFSVRFDEESRSNVWFVKGGVYDDDKLSEAVARVEEDFGISVRDF